MTISAHTALNKRAILVTGGHRTGTTWVGRMLSASGETAYISEPLNVWHRPGVMGAPVPYWYTYICDDNAHEFLPALKQTLALEYLPGREIRSLKSMRDFLRMLRDFTIFTRGRLTDQRPLIKDPFAVFSVEWFAQQLDCEIVISVRHPAAFVASLKRLHWPFNMRDLLAQPLLMRDGLEPYRAEMESVDPGDIVAQGSLLWRMIYEMTRETCEKNPRFILARHEDLSRHPIDGFRALYEKLGLKFTPRVGRTILNSSSSENPAQLSLRKTHSTSLNSEASLDNWKRVLNAAETERVRAITWNTYLKYYREDEW
jgi:hypothetical protein